jgi:hypothetical protein
MNLPMAWAPMVSTTGVVVGWSMAEHLRTEWVGGALEMAVPDRHPDAGVIHHSDHGCQYTSLAFGQRCQAVGIRCSMGSVGDCSENAMAESFFATLECGLLVWQPSGRITTPAWRSSRTSKASTTVSDGTQHWSICRWTPMRGGGLRKHRLSPNAYLSTEPG